MIRVLHRETICDSPKCVAVDVEESQVKLGHEYALKALEAQSRDRDSQRLFRRKVMAWSLWFGVFLVVLLAAFSSYALSLGQDRNGQRHDVADFWYRRVGSRSVLCRQVVLSRPKTFG